MSLNCFGQYKKVKSEVSDFSTIVVVETSATAEEVLDAVYYGLRKERIRIELRDDISLETELIRINTFGWRADCAYSVFVNGATVEVQCLHLDTSFGSRKMTPLNAMNKKAWRLVHEIVEMIPGRDQVMYAQLAKK